MEKVEAMIDRDQTGWEEILLENFRWSNEDCIAALEALEVPLIAINADLIPTAEIKILSNTGHVMMWEVTEDFNRTLEVGIQHILASEK